MTRCLAISLSLLLSFGVFASSRITSSGKYVYIVTPFNEMTSSDRRETLAESSKFMVAELTKLFPSKERDPGKAIREVNEKRQAIDNVIQLADQYLKNDGPGANSYELFPSALMFMFGGGYQKQFMLSISGSFNIGLVVMPSKVQRISKANPDDQKTYYTFECSIVLLPVGDIGLGLQPDDKSAMQFRYGGGLIFGDMIQPTDFFGLTAGISTSSNFGPGFHGKIMGVVDTKGVKFTLATFSIVKGAVSPFEIHANIGYVKPLSSFMGAYDRISGFFVGKDSAPAPAPTQPQYPYPSPYDPSPSVVTQPIPVQVPQALTEYDGLRDALLKVHTEEKMEQALEAK